MVTTLYINMHMQNLYVYYKSSNLMHVMLFSGTSGVIWTPNNWLNKFYSCYGVYDNCSHYR